jgi:hypothetical protein
MQNKTKTTKTITTKTTNRRRRRVAKRGILRRRIRRAIRRQRRQIPLARPVAFKRSIINTNIANTTARVTGNDLVYKIPTTITNANANVIAIIPSNPAYWKGTRVATIAKGYQNYRPLKFNVHYVPQCAATQAGNVIAGTIYHEAPSVDNLQQSLKTSNGGMITQVFKPATSVIKVGTNLQKNLYRIGGNIDDDSMPFYFVAVAIACKDSNNNPVVPGYFYVEYSYLFKNPIGSSIEFANSGLSTFNSALGSIKKANVKAILCEDFVTEPVTLAIGTQLDIEYDYDDQSWKFYYNQTAIATPNKYLWIFSNEQSNALNQQQMKAMTKTEIIYDEQLDADPRPETIILQPYTALIEEAPNGIIRTYMTEQLLKEVELNSNKGFKYYLSYDTDQPFGNFDYLYDDIISFTADALLYYLKKTTVVRKPPTYNLAQDYETTLINLSELTLEAKAHQTLMKDPKVIHLPPSAEEPK